MAWSHVVFMKRVIFYGQNRELLIHANDATKQILYWYIEVLYSVSWHKLEAVAAFQINHNKWPPELIIPNIIIVMLRTLWVYNFECLFMWIILGSWLLFPSLFTPHIVHFITAIPYTVFYFQGSWVLHAYAKNCPSSPVFIYARLYTFFFFIVTSNCTFS